MELSMSNHFVHVPTDTRIFVFGSNTWGIHGAGAARYAHINLGAEWGVSEGLTGRAYALPTCYAPGSALSLSEIAEAVDRFIEFAKTSSDRFFVSEVGCGLAGFTSLQIAPLFANAPDNCDLPPGWRV